ncbi:hypothetical protein EGW08_010718, partial [Elysia chlorotica]
GFCVRLKKLQNLAAALAPSYVRFGGTLADFVDFDPDGVQSPDSLDSEGRGVRDAEDAEDLPISIKLPGGSHVAGLRWDNITRFCDIAGWDIMWDFNLLHFKKGRWDPTYAKKFLKYSASRGVRIPSFQLGNEPNLYKPKFNLDIDGNQLAEDFWTLKDVLSEMPQYAGSGLYGPDVTNLDQHKSARTYLAQYVSHAVFIIIYYLKGEEAKLKDFIDPRVMDGLKTQLEYGYNITWDNCRVRKPLRLTETSTATGGGVEGISNAYVAGFLWLDKLGVSAMFGVTHIFRQTFFASNYALISRELEPNP